MVDLKSKKISVVSLWTDKMSETIDFYSRILGLKRCSCNSYHMKPPHFEIDGTFLVLLNGKTHTQKDSEHFPVIAITVDNLENACEVLKENGIPLIMEIKEDSSSRWTFCKDPGGNLIELAIWK
jgi:predicted enzyme related to lactoylglutathione lyase